MLTHGSMFVLDLSIAEDAPSEVVRRKEPVSGFGDLFEPSFISETRLVSVDVVEPLLLPDDLEILFVENLPNIGVRVREVGFTASPREGENVLSDEFGHLVEDWYEVFVTS